ncbi:hypothetical protein TNCV_3720981 [Trichonephila clavipes]|nr:hypothetical protein TNCV_3720981 [Trichonephila clavipes]
MPTIGPKVFCRLWNQFQTSGTITGKVSQGHHRTLTSAQDYCLALKALRHRQTTTPQHTRDLAALSERISRQAVLKTLAFTPGVQSVASF